MAGIRDRIKSLRRVKASLLVPHPQNWRRHPEAQKGAMRAALDEIGYADALIVREREDGKLELIDGHLRASVTPDQKVPVLVTDLSEDEAKALLATLDPLAGMAEVDPEALTELMREAHEANPALADLLAAVGDSEGVDWLGAETDEGYTKTVETPIYEPTGPQPDVSELLDRTAADALIGEIDKANMPDELTEFLVAAAERHVGFNYQRIANYYAHAPAEVQRLMEASALVVIDYEQAIAQGIVHYAGQIDAVFHEDYPDA